MLSPTSSHRCSFPRIVLSSGHRPLHGGVEASCPSTPENWGATPVPAAKKRSIDAVRNTLPLSSAVPVLLRLAVKEFVLPWRCATLRRHPLRPQYSSTDAPCVIVLSCRASTSSRIVFGVWTIDVIATLTIDVIAPPRRAARALHAKPRTTRAYCSGPSSPPPSLPRPAPDAAWGRSRCNESGHGLTGSGPQRSATDESTVPCHAGKEHAQGGERSLATAVAARLPSLCWHVAEPNVRHRCRHHVITVEAMCAAACTRSGCTTLDPKE